MIQATPATELPGLPPIPVVGKRLNGGRLGMIRLFSNPVGMMQRLYRDYGAIAAVTRGDPALVCAFGPDYNQQLLPHARQFYNFAEFPFKVPPDSALARFNNNLTAMNGDTHRLQRRLMMPAFHKQVVQSYRDSMVMVAEQHLAQWAAQPKLDLVHEMVELTLSVMMRCLFGLDVADEAQELGHMGMDFMEQIISPKVMMFPVDLPGTPFRRFLRFSDHFEKRLLDIIQKRRSQGDQGQDVLSILINTHDEDGTRLSDEELVGQTGMLFVAGHETTAYTLVWTLLLLAQHPQVWYDLKDELAGKLQGDAPTIEQLRDLPLLDAVVKESMRLLPPTPLLFVREGVSNFQLGPYEMPAGSQVVLSPFITHRMADIYPEPACFKPERWAQFKPSPFAYLPFGTGPRMCLGAGFAELEVRLVLALILQRFYLHIADNTQIDYKVRGIILGTKQGIPVQVTPSGQELRKPAAIRGSIRQLVKLA